jgi:hypothetical protein
MKSMERAIQIGMSVSLTLAIAMYSSLAGACPANQKCYPSCPSGSKCLDVTSASATGTGCTLVNAVTAVNNQATFNKCTFPSGATVVRLPVISGSKTTSSTTYFPNTTLSLQGVSITGLGVTATIINFKNATPNSPAAIDFSTSGLQNPGLQTVAIVDGGSAQTLTGVQIEPGSPTVTIDHVQISGFNNSGVVNNSILVMHNSTIQNNFGDQGGGIHDMTGAVMSIDTSTIANNNALGGGGIFEEGISWLAYDTIAFNGAEVGGGVEISDPASFDAFHLTVAMNSASLPFTALPCGAGGGVYAPDPDFGVDANWNASIIAGNTDGTPGQADDLVGDLHFTDGGSEVEDGANQSIVGNPQVGMGSCQVGGWQSSAQNGTNGTFLFLNDKQASPAQLFGTSNPTLASHPSNAATQDLALVKPKSGTNPAINSVENYQYNLGTYETQGATFPGGKYTSGRLSNPPQNKIDQGGQPAPSDGNENLSYCIGSFEIQ